MTHNEQRIVFRTDRLTSADSITDAVASAEVGVLTFIPVGQKGKVAEVHITEETHYDEERGRKYQNIDVLLWDSEESARKLFTEDGAIEALIHSKVIYSQDTTHNRDLTTHISNASAALVFELLPDLSS